MRNVILYWICRGAFHTFSFLFFPRSVTGQEYLPSKGGFIVVANHISNLDPFIIGLSSPHRKLSFMAKDSLFRNKFIGIIFYGMKAFPIDRTKSDTKALKTTLAILKSGEGVVMFPEGTRKKDGVAAEPKAGIGFLVNKANVPIVPVYLRGSDQVMAPGAKWPKRKKVFVKFGPAFRMEQSRDYLSISKHVMDKVYELEKA